MPSRPCNLHECFRCLSVDAPAITSRYSPERGGPESESHQFYPINKLDNGINQVDIVAIRMTL
jgi:hypothetical protein